MPPHPKDAELAAHYAHCEALLRERDRDTWLACLFAPAETRRHLHALYAFVAEVGDIRARVSQPLLGEMRLRWWADAINGDENGGGARAHPGVDALLDTIERFALPRADFVALIDARVFDLYDDPMETQAMLEAYCRDVFVAPMRWAARTLGATDGGGPAVEAAGLSLGLTKILRALPAQAAAGQCFIPADLLARHGATTADICARATTSATQAAIAELRGLAKSRYEAARAAAPSMEAGRAALLPAASVPLYLDQLERGSRDPFQPQGDPPRWRRQWRLWRAARGVGL